MKSSQIAAVKMFLRYGSKLLGYILNFFCKVSRCTTEECSLLQDVVRILDISQSHCCQDVLLLLCSWLYLIIL